MPELPEVETVRRGLNHVTLHQTILGGQVLLNRTIAHPLSVPEFLVGLQETAIAQWHRRGKYLLAELFTPDSPAGWLGVHLRMTGQLLWLDQAEPLQKHARVRLFFAGNKELRFVDQRTFGQMWWVPPDQPPEHVITGLQQLGPEPFSDEFSVSYLEEQLRQRRRPIKNALLDQALVAGVGNIYADEALFLSGIHPQTLCTELERSQIERLRQTLLQVLQASIDARGTTISTFRDVEGVNGNYGGMAWVYARNGEHCRTCDTIIQRLKLAGRSAHFCPSCQPSAMLTRLRQSE
ncbi:DNA-formamidopyrimidine glycosylase [Leptolyngbya sp. FACHB-36]|uniref:DNA-formamidopyrimidine glycosylase n=1 Tax=Leptolyngbya sp. FACHB-36 TaxID=2692808 RepID=UPI0016817410|nr:DNA-formamidopyrimidine glycosylase [Leptolyngbya sp. FACHB-36]